MTYYPETIKAAYDAIAVKEDDFERSFALRNEIPREFIKKYLTPPDCVLDAGGGTGINAIMMAQRCQRVTLLDISSEILKLAARNTNEAGLIEKIELVEGDITNLAQFESGKFSFVVCLGGSISYVLEKAEQAIQELVRVAKRGAYLIIGCDGKYGFVRWLVSQGEFDVAQQVYETGKYEAGEGAYARLYTPAELKKLLEDAGCKIIELASAPILMNAWTQKDCSEPKQTQLKTLEMEFCTRPKLIGIGHHLFCVARKL